LWSAVGTSPQGNPSHIQTLIRKSLERAAKSKVAGLISHEQV